MIFSIILSSILSTFTPDPMIVMENTCRIANCQQVCRDPQGNLTSVTTCLDNGDGNWSCTQCDYTETGGICNVQTFPSEDCPLD